MYIYMLQWMGDAGGIDEQSSRLFFDESVAKAYATKHNIHQYHIEMMWVHDEV